jgi:uncharacterized protein
MHTKKKVANYKILFSGPVGAGKTSAIRSLCGDKLLTTEEEASDMTRHRKKTTTVALDYGTLRISDSEVVHLYGTPGQERFDFMWEILRENGLGLILMISNGRPSPLADLRFFLDAFKEFIAKTALVVGVTHLDEKPAPDIAAYRNELKAAGHGAIPVLEVDARAKQDISILVQALLYQVDPNIPA